MKAVKKTDVLAPSRKLVDIKSVVDDGSMVGTMNMIGLSTIASDIETRICKHQVKSIDELEIHPACSLFPMMEGDEWQRFRNDIRDNGLNLESAIYFDEKGRVIDGRHRLRAVIDLLFVGDWPRELRELPPFKTMVGDDEAILSRVISDNLYRRHLSPSQKAWMAETLCTGERGGDRGGRRYGSKQRANLPFACKPMEAVASEWGIGKTMIKKARNAKKQLAEMDDQTIAQQLFESIQSGVQNINWLNNVLEGKIEVSEGVCKLGSNGKPKKEAGVSRKRQPSTPQERALKQIHQAMANIHKMDESDEKAQLESTINSLIDALSKALH